METNYTFFRQYYKMKLSAELKNIQCQTPKYKLLKNYFIVFLFSACRFIF